MRQSPRALHDDVVRLAVGLDWTLWLDHLPLLLAERMPEAADAGLKPVILEPVDGYDTIEFVAAGKLDVACVAFDQLVYAAARGLPVCTIGTLLHGPAGMLTLEAHAIRTARDLAGRRIGCQRAPRPWTAQLLRGVAGGDITAIDAGWDLAAALAGGECDAAWDVFDAGIARHPTLAGLEPRLLTYAELGLPDVGRLELVVNRANDSVRNLEALRRFRRLVALATDAVRRDPAPAVAALVRLRPALDRDWIAAALAPTVANFVPGVRLPTRSEIATIIDGFVTCGILDRHDAPEPAALIPDAALARLLGLAQPA